MRRLGIAFFAVALLAGAGFGAAAPGAAASSPANPTFLYAVNDGVVNTVSAYTVRHDGSLHEIAGSPFLTGGAGDAARPDGYAFISASTVAVVRVADRLYVANMGSTPATVSAFAINTRTGALRALRGSPYTLGFSDEFSLAVTPDRHFVFAAQVNAHNVETLRVNRDGSLDTAHRVDTGVGIITDGIAVSADGRWLAIAGLVDMTVTPQDFKIQVFKVSARTGALTEATGSPMPTMATTVAFGPSHNGRTTLFAGTLAGAVEDYAVTPTTITKISSVTVNSEVSGLQGIAVTPDGSMVYASEAWTSSLYSFAVDRHGVLSLAAGPVAVGPTRVLEGVTLSPDGKRLYFSLVGEDAGAGAPGSIGAVRLGSHGLMSGTVPGLPMATGQIGWLRSIVLVEGEAR